MQPGLPVPEDELHAYIDGALDPARRLAVATYLAAHPREAARAEAFRAQREGIHALFSHILDQPVPERLRLPLRRARMIWRRIAWAVGATSAVLVLIFGGGVLQYRYHLPFPFLHDTAMTAPHELPAPSSDDRTGVLPLAHPPSFLRNADI